MTYLSGSYHTMQIIFTSVTLLRVVGVCFYYYYHLPLTNAVNCFPVILTLSVKIYSSVIVPFGLMLSMSCASCRRATRGRNGRSGGKRRARDAGKKPKGGQRRRLKGRIRLVAVHHVGGNIKNSLVSSNSIHP